MAGLSSPALTPPAEAAVTGTTLFAVDGEHQTVVRFTGGATGAFSATVVGRDLDSVSHLTSDAAGNVYLLDGGRLVRISSDGVQRSVAANLTGLDWLVVDARGTVYVADDHSVTRIYQPSGKQSLMGTIADQSIEGLGVDSAGRPTVIVYPGDENNARRRRFPQPPAARRPSAF